MNHEHNQQVEQLPQVENPYKNSEIVSSLLIAHQEGAPMRIAFADIDSTLTGKQEDQQAAYDALIDAGYKIVFVTSRTPEMTLSREAAEKSVEFNRPAPKLKKDDTSAEGIIDKLRESGATFSTAYPDEVPSFAGIYGGVATLASTGSEIWIRQVDGSYRLDQDYEATFNVNKETWRPETRAKIDAVNEAVGGIAQYAPLEDITNFNEGRMDVASPDLRFQMNFNSLEEQLVFTEQMNAAHPEVKIIEDGKPSEGRFQIYMTPQGAGKDIGVETFFQGVMREMNAQLPEGNEVVPGDFETIFLGDSWPDLPMGIYGAEGSNATLLLVGGSRLTPLIGDQRSEKVEFASVDFTSINDRIIPLPEQGHYELGDRKIVVADEAFPGTKAPTSISAHINSQS